MKLKSACILAGLCTLVGQQPSHSAPVLDDALQGSTTGTRSGGVFVAGGWRLTGKDDAISNVKVWNFASQTNVVRLSGKSLYDDSGPFLGLGVSYFQALRHAKYDRDRLNRNLALFAAKGFNYVRVLSMVSWDGLEPNAPFTVFCNGQPNRYWPEVKGATNGCHRNIGSAKGSEFVCFPMGILAGGVTLEARRPVQFQVLQPLTGAAVSNLTLNGGERFTLAQGPGAYVLKGTFPSRPRGTAQVEETRPKPLKP